MQRENGFTLVELLVVIMIIGVLIGMSVPNYRQMRDRARETAVQLNMRVVTQAITSYFAENGHYADDFYEDGYGYIFDGGVKDQTLGVFPNNPYTGKPMDPDDFNVDEYSDVWEVTSTTVNGPNDEWGYDPGQIRYSTYTPLGNYYPTMWGMIGFNTHGWSIRHTDPDDVDRQIIFVLHQ